MAENYTHRYAGNHPQDIVVGDKVLTVEPGQMLRLSKDDLAAADNKWLVDDSLIMDLSTVKGGEKT